jgi:uncharacterized membrane protein
MNANYIFLTPSLYAHVINGILLLIAIIIFVLNFSKIIKLGPYKLIVLYLLFSVVIGIHGISHLGLEKGYGYNPFHIMNLFFYK